MRQLFIEVPRGRALEVLAVAEAHDAVNVSCVAADGPSGPTDLVIVHVSNAKVGQVVGALEGIAKLRVTFAPQGVLALRPPPEETAAQVTDVDPRSPLEVLLSGLQSIGSWRAFLAYAAAGAAITWVGLFTNTSYLLIAAMLIAPFAGPAMNAALGTARGDTSLLGRSMLWYVAGLAVAIFVSGALSLLLQQEVATTAMVDASQLSSTAIVLPLVAGAAGALNIAQSERNSLVSGAATGMLVAASLAPPAGLMGMGAVLGEWGMVKSAGFLLLLQAFGINLSGAIVLRLYGISPQGPRYARGTRWAFPAALGLSAVACAGLMAWQLWSTPSLQRSSRAQRATAAIHSVVDASGLAHVVDTTVRFTRADVPGQSSLLAIVYVQPSSATHVSACTVRERLARAIDEGLRARGFDVTPLVDVKVLVPSRSERVAAVDACP